VTSANYLAVKKAVPWFLNLQVGALGRATSMPKGYVNTIPGVKEMDKNVSSHNSIEQVGGSLFGGPGAERTHQQLQPKAKGSSRHAHVGSGQVQMRNLGEHKTAASVVDEYVDILKPLEAKGNAWRKYKLGSQAWYDRVHIYRYIDLKMGEQGGTKQSASAALQILADTTGKQGNSNAPNWKEIGKKLRDTDPREVGLRQLKKRRAAENKKKKQEKKQATELGAADDHITHLAPDNSIVPDEDVGPLTRAATEGYN